MFSTVGSWISAGVEAVAEKVGADVKLDEQYNDETTKKQRQQTGSGTSIPPPPAGTEDSSRTTNSSKTQDERDTKNSTRSDGIDASDVELLPIWEEPPTALVNHRDAWRTLVLGLMQDENTFIISQKRLSEENGGGAMKDIVQLLSLQKGEEEEGSEEDVGNGGWERRINDPALCARMEAKIIRIQEMLVSQSLPDLNKLRYKISPHFVSDAQFWMNFKFRLCVLHQCRTLETLLDLLEPMNTEPCPGVQRKRNMGTSENAAVLQQIRDAVNAKTIQTEWVAKRKEVALDCLEAGRNSCSMLHSLLLTTQKKEAAAAEAELLDSVAESCKYHKSKVGGLIGELQAPGSADKLTGSGLEPEGSIMEQLLTLNDDLQQKLEAFVTRIPAHRSGKGTVSQGSTAAQSPSPVEVGGTSPAPSIPPAGLSRAGSTLSASGSAAGSPPPPPGVEGSSDNAFNASLPWDDED